MKFFNQHWAIMLIAVLGSLSLYHDFPPHEEISFVTQSVATDLASLEAASTPVEKRTQLLRIREIYGSLENWAAELLIFSSGITQLGQHNSALGEEETSMRVLGSFDCTTVTDVSVEECEALVALYEATDGDNWTDDTNWLETTQIDEWFGLSSIRHSRGKINLSNNGLNGEIPAELGDLVSLSDLDLSNNNLIGGIPAELGNIDISGELNLSSNGLNGEIPVELGNISKLQRLNLEKNQLSGKIPKEISNLDRLSFLNLSFNQLVGNIPPELGSLDTLSSIILNNNQITGEIPVELSNLQYFSRLEINNNKLCGNINQSLLDLVTQGLYLNYHYNNLSLREDEHPTFYGTQTPENCNICIHSDGDNVCDNVDNCIFTDNEDQVDTYENGVGDACDICTQVTDVLPSECEALMALYYSTDGDNWRGSEWGIGRKVNRRKGITVENKKIKSIKLSNVGLVGKIPRELGNLNNLENLDLSRNEISGNIPKELGNLSTLSQLNLSDNKLTGEIPAELGGLHKILSWMELDKNELTGEIPKELGNLNVTRLLLNENKLSGSIPKELGNLQNIEWLRLGQNELSGEIPVELSNLTDLQQLSLSRNNLSGEVPKELLDLDNLNLLNLKINNLCGDFSDFLNSNIHYLFYELNNLTVSENDPTYDTQTPEECTGTIQQCGNHIREGDEQCDDGNLIDGDGCDSLCMNEGTACIEDYSAIHFSGDKPDQSPPNTMDRVKLQQYINGVSLSAGAPDCSLDSFACDIDGDGIIDGGDFEIMRNFTLNILNGYDICGDGIDNDCKDGPDDGCPNPVIPIATELFCDNGINDNPTINNDIDCADPGCIGDPACLDDFDNDGILDNDDNCEFIFNPLQVDTEGDGVGDACDNCIGVENPGQENVDGDAFGDACDCGDGNDVDADGACDLNGDNCPDVHNPFQMDEDNDGVGDACDNCVFDENPFQADGDLDGVGADCDNCQGIPNPGQKDTNLNGIGDICDCDATGDPDMDGVCDPFDNCPFDANPFQADGDLDGIGNACENTSICGDGEIGQYEECDDAGESASCDSNCTTAWCGDTTINMTAGEQCDDGNSENGDGCENDCKVTPLNLCGNGFLDGNEECDDGNMDSGDTCDATCMCEGGLISDGIGGCKVATFCGDGTIQSPNDDGVYEVCEGSLYCTACLCDTGYVPTSQGLCVLDSPWEYYCADEPAIRCKGKGWDITNKVYDINKWNGAWKNHDRCDKYASYTCSLTSCIDGSCGGGKWDSSVVDAFNTENGTVYIDQTSCVNHEDCKDYSGRSNCYASSVVDDEFRTNQGDSAKFCTILADTSGPAGSITGLKPDGTIGHIQDCTEDTDCDYGECDTLFSINWTLAGEGGKEFDYGACVQN